MKYVKRILFILLFLIPLKVNAYVNYDITDFLVDATVLQDGNMEVKELIVLKGTFHGYVRDIAYRNSKLTNNSNSYSDNDIYNAKGITDVQTSAMKLETPATFQTFNEIFYPLTRVYFDSDAENGNYLETSFQDGKSYKMYYEGNNETVAFLITYKIESPVVIHNDVAELYWTFIGNGFEDEINNLQIKVHLPNNDQTDLFRFWAHGDITGNINKEDNQTIVATMKSLSKNNPVDLRITFDKEMITNQSNLNKVNEEALPKIIEVETKEPKLVMKKERLLS